MMEFWKSWQIWEKMGFILACSIAVVFVYAFIVRTRNNSRIKKHALRNAAEAAERGEMQQTRESDEVPFGIRAVEEGCEVEGVWNSKTNTPLQTAQSSCPGTPMMKPKNTLKKKRDSSISTQSAFDTPKSAVLSRSCEAAADRTSGGSFESGVLNMLVDAVRRPRRQVTSFVYQPVHQPCQRRSQTGEPNHLPYTYDKAKSASNSSPLQAGLDLTDNQLLSARRFLHCPRTPADVAKSSVRRIVIGGRLSHDGEKSGASLTLAPADAAVPSKGVESLELMNAHRQSHAAEVGQLIPRVRRNASNGGFTPDVTPKFAEAGKAYFGVRAISWPVEKPALQDNSKEARVPVASRGQPFTVFQATVKDRANFLDTEDSRKLRGPQSVSGEIENDIGILPLAMAALSSHNPRVRKVNAGLELRLAHPSQSGL